ncbi:hypothetical protein E4U31_002090 [Claviceps sp. LM219 group G6]|nr:hypothetical protein E4U31_002090 [Claviceps sp. LM219 group G6]
MARQMAQQARLGLIDGWFRQQLGHSANEEMSRAYGLPKSLFDACGGPRDPAVPAQPSMSAQGISGGWNYYQPNQVHFPPVPQQGYAYWPQQANVFQFAPAPAPAFAPAPVPVAAPAPIPAPAPAPIPVYSPALVPVRARYTTVDVSDLCPPMEYEETEVLAPERVEYEFPTFEAVGVSYAAAVNAMIEASVLCLADEHEKGLIVPVEHVEDSSPTVEAVDVETGVNPLPFQHHEHEDATVEDVITIKDADVVEDITTAEDVTDEDLPLRPTQSLEGVDEDTPESVSALDKRESMSVTDMIDEDEVPLPLSVPLVREKTVKGNARAFSEIWGCEGIGSVALKGVIAFLMQPWMINRELPTQVRKLSRIIIPIP